MRPLALTFSAFGPYAHVQTLDFTQLEDRNFFLIHGPTGAGKSSILDAMCFALYGETSGGEKETRHIRSDFSLPHEETLVSFDFRLGDKTFRVSRSPEQERPKKRGEGTTRQLAQATVWQMDGEKKIVLADRWGKVTEEIIRITGFDVHQFRQVVVLPQGQFRQFLLAGSADRQKILETLFQTGRYRDIEEALKEAAKSIKQAYEDVARRKTLLLESEEAPDDTGLDSQISQMAEQVTAQDALLKTLRSSEQIARNNLEQARIHQTLLVEKQNATQALAVLVARETAVANQKKDLKRANAAHGLNDAEAMLIARLKETEEAQRHLIQARTDVESARKSKDQAHTLFEKEKTREPEILSARSELSDLHKINEQLGAFVGSEKKYDQARAQMDTLARLHHTQKKNLDTLAKDIRVKTDELEKARQGAAQVDSLSVHYEQLKKNKDRLQALDTHSHLLKDAEKKKQTAQDSQRLCEQALTREKEVLEQLENDYHSGQAALLAAQLESGLPCPVCGSTDHPNKAAGASDLPDEKKIKATRVALKKQEQELKEKNEQAAQASEAWISCVTRQRALEEELGHLIRENPESFERDLKQTHSQLKAAQAHGAALPVLIKALERLVTQEQEQKTILDNTVQALDGAAQEKARCQAVMDERKKSIPEAYHDPSRLECRVNDLTQFIRQAETALEKARHHRETSLNVFSAKSQALVSTQETVTKAEHLWRHSSDAFTQRLQNAGFADQNDYRAASLSEHDIGVLETAITAYGEQRNAAQDRLARASEAAHNLTLPDIPALRIRVDDITGRMETTGSEKARCETLLVRKKKVFADLKDLSVRSAHLERQYSSTGSIADVANARGANTSGMTFQRYVLAALFDDVLYSAGRHLKSMSRNRFDLEREQDRTDRRSAGGLDLRVVDAHTGTSRPVSTLSGGESFLASLSLALGLADVVQSYAGGIKLDTIFVDEGFGSLDPETLDLAFRAFADLQVTGRLVGIISHVPELKERIPTRLDVFPTNRGSMARFVM